jgi:hypothetical protein
MKKFAMLFLVALLALPLAGDRTYSESFTTETSFNLAASGTALRATNFTSPGIKVSKEVGARMALFTMEFARSAGSSSTVDFYLQVSYDDGVTWSDFVDPVSSAEYFSVATEHAVMAATTTTVRVSYIIHLAGVDHIRLSKVVNGDSSNALTAVKATLSW